MPGGLQGGGGGGGGGGYGVRRKRRSGAAGSSGGCAELIARPTHKHASTAALPTLNAIARRATCEPLLPFSTLQRTSSKMPSARRAMICIGSARPGASSDWHSHRSDSISAIRASRTDRGMRHVYARVHTRTAATESRNSAVMPAPPVCDVASTLWPSHQLDGSRVRRPYLHR
jgi:hypothetical protein